MQVVARLFRTGSVRWGRAGRGGTTCTNLWLSISSPVPLTGVCQPAGAAGGGTAPVPTRGGGQSRGGGGLSPERSRWAEPPLPDARSAPNPKVPIAEHSLLRAGDLRNAFRSINIEDFHDLSFYLAQHRKAQWRNVI